MTICNNSRAMCYPARLLRRVCADWLATRGGIHHLLHAWVWPLPATARPPESRLDFAKRWRHETRTLKDCRDQCATAKRKAYQKKQRRQNEMRKRFWSGQGYAFKISEMHVTTRSRKILWCDWNAATKGPRTGAELTGPSARSTEFASANPFRTEQAHSPGLLAPLLLPSALGTLTGTVIAFDPHGSVFVFPDSDAIAFTTKHTLIFLGSTRCGGFFLSPAKESQRRGRRRGRHHAARDKGSRNERLCHHRQQDHE